MDMLNADLALKNEAISTGNNKNAQSDQNESDAGFHFIAFMPIEESLWKFDGLERQPMSLGEFNSADSRLSPSNSPRGRTYHRRLACSGDT